MAEANERPGVDRRQFLKVLGVTGAGAATLSGCSTDKVEKLVPYLVQSEQQVPGVPTVYASTCTECSTGCGIHVKTREGRAIKLEGNPAHPVNKGSLCSRGQAGLQALYNPDRIGTPRARNAAGGFDEITWDDAIARLSAKLGPAQGKVAALNGYGDSAFSTLLRDVVTALGGRTVQWEPLGRHAERKANEKTFGRSDLARYDFAQAKHIVSFGADFLETWGLGPEQERGFAAAHSLHDGGMAKHVAVGPRMSLTAANADEWLSVAPGREAPVALAMAKLVAEHHGHALAGSLAQYTAEWAAKESGLTAAKITEVAHAFAAATPSLAVAGGVGAQHRGAIELCHAVNLLNLVAGNVGRTVRFENVLGQYQGHDAVQGLFDAMGRGEIAVVLVHEANPLYALPKSGKYAETFAKVGFKVSTANVIDETAAACDLILPNLHALERWDDLTAIGGVRGLLQPVMEPVFPGKHTGDVLLAVAKKVGGPLAGFTAADFAAHLKGQWTTGDDAWRAALANGGTWSDAPPADVPAPAATGAAPSWTAPAFDGDGEYVFAPYPSMHYHDGTGTNKPWLLENPDPMTKITWQSWVEVHPETAKKLDVREGEYLELTSPHGSLKAQVYVFPGVREDTLAMPLGLGHTEYGRYAKGRGVNALDLLGHQDGQGFLPYLATKVHAKAAGEYRKVAKTEGNPRQLGRGIIEAMPLAHAAKGMTPEESYKASGHEPHEINTEREKEAIDGWYEAQKARWALGDYARDGVPKWGMAVDLSRCTGCSACVTACYAENNIPTVGEEQIFRGREMSWMRIERYWEGGEHGEPLEARFAPMLCQHCDNAPCEPVCPVYAAYHTPDGLNGQVYNRCVGTRYCSNNCPYKVRYFNWLKYNESAWPAPLNLQLNPEVTVRARGVMEKCTFCIQRIRGAQHQARLEDRPLKDGEVVTACQQACASGAITFGDVKDPDSAVVKAKRDPRGYTILEEINVRSAITYLAKVLHREPAAHAAAEATPSNGGGH